MSARAPGPEFGGCSRPIHHLAAAESMATCAHLAGGADRVVASGRASRLTTKSGAGEGEGFMSTEIPSAVQSGFSRDVAEVLLRLERLGISATPRSAAEIATILQSTLRPEPHR